MLFNSVEFFVFFVIVFTVHWAVGRSARLQNMVLLAASLFFYGWADLRFMGLLLLSAAMNLAIGVGLVGKSSERFKSLLFWTGIAVNLGILVLFKYFNFFYAGFIDLAQALGSGMTFDPLALILPLGVSFFTFQTVGYLIDVRNEEIEPSRDPLAFFTYIFFFPKMLAGPIERAQKFLPQLDTARVFDRADAMDGCRRILWGLFAKVVVADNCGRIVNPIFNHDTEMSGTALLLGALLYLVQLYADFSGYSNIALGTARLLGIRLMRNFAMPLFATNIADFWRRWHISLSSWMMDYLYTPLSFIFRDRGRAGGVLAIFITFFTVGIWHGANWTFVLFGVLQGLYFIPLALAGPGIQRGSADPGSSASALLRMAGMFLLMGITFVLLRADSIDQTMRIWSRIFSPSVFTGWGYSLKEPEVVFLVTALFGLIEWLGRKDDFALASIGLAWPRPVRWGVYWALGMSVFLLSFRPKDFIYFQF